MNPPGQVAPKQKGSKVCCFIEVVILLTVLLAVFVGLVYYFGSQQPHADIPHALDQIFGDQIHQDLVTDLNKKANQHAILWGQNQTGIFQFLEHYADVRASKGGLVIVKRVQNNAFQTALKFIRYTKQYIEQNINLESDAQKVQWIFLVHNGQIPVDQLQRIKSTRPKDRVVVGVNQKSKIKGYKTIKFPAIDLQVVQKVISSEFDITAKQASILANYYGSIPQILKHLDQISYTHEKHLGPNYQNLKDLGKTQLKTLKVLCANGVAPLDGNIAALEEIGAVTFEKKVYWEERVNRLNYELSQQVQCVDKVVPEDIKEKIAEKRQQQSKAEIEGTDDQQQKPAQQSSASSKKKSPKQPQSQKKQQKSKTEQKPAQKSQQTKQKQAAKEQPAVVKKSEAKQNKATQKKQEQKSAKSAGKQKSKSKSKPKQKTVVEAEEEEEVKVEKKAAGKKSSNKSK